MDFKITILRYVNEYIAVAQKGLITYISERHEDEDDAREDVKQQVHQHYVDVYNSVHNIDN